MDKNTAEKLYEAFYMKVFSYVMTLAKDRNDAEEITQETFFRAISTDKAFKGESESFTWLCAIAKNIFIDEKRRVSRQDDELSEELPDTNKGIEEKLTDRDQSLKIHLSNCGYSVSCHLRKSDQSSERPRPGPGLRITEPD